MDRPLRREVEKISGDVIRFTQELVRIPSPSLHEKDAAGVVAEAMRELRYDLVFTDDVGNSVGVIRGSDSGSAILMSSHMDTVRPDHFESWNRSPFSGDIVHGRIEGVGAADCKGGLAAQIYAGHVLSASRFVPVSNIVMAATVAEENGCSVGVRHLLKTTLPELGMRPRFVVLGEPTALTIGSGHDGWVGIDIDIISPVDGVARSAGKYVFQVLSAHCEESGRNEIPAIMTVKQPRVGLSDHGYLETIRLYRRLFPGEVARDVLGWLERTFLEKTREIHAVFLEARVHQEEQRLYTGHTKRIRLSVPPWSTDLMHPLVDRARESMLAAGCRWIPKAWKLGNVGMGTAGGVVSREFGIPTIGYGPGEEQEAQACNESVSLSAVVDAVYGTATLLHGLTSAPLDLPSAGVRAEDERLVTCVG